jgi:hypothetical protein
MEIKKGDIVKITNQNIAVEGKVDSAINYGTDDNPNWYIEIKVTRGITHNTPIGMAAYWKQQIDGGTVEMIKES